jgi:Phage derived protein Gp49-like (DUF891)
MADWAVDEYKTATGQSPFAEFVVGLADAKDIKDTGVLVGALWALGNRLIEPRSKSLGRGLFELRGTTVRIYYGFLPSLRAILLGGYLKKRTDSPANLLRLIRTRLKDAQYERQKSRLATARKKDR